MRLLLVLVVLLAACCPARAQTGSAKTPTALTNEINTLAADNTTNAFTLNNLRQITLDLVQSMLNNVQYGVSSPPSQFPQLPASPGALWATLAGPTTSGDLTCINNTSGSITLVDCGSPPPVLITNLPPVPVSLPKSIGPTDCGTTQIIGGTAFYTITVPAASGVVSGCFIQLYNADTRGKYIQSTANDFNAFILWPQQTATLTANGATAWILRPPGRWILTAALTNFYVDATNGSTTSDCLSSSNGVGGSGSPGSPCKTITQCQQLAAAFLDMHTNQIACHVANGTYVENVANFDLVGRNNGAQQASACVIGNSSSPTSVVIAPTSGPAIYGTPGTSTPWCYQYLTLAATNSQNFLGDFASKTYMDGIVEAGSSITLHQQAIYGAKLEIGTHGVTVSANAAAFDSVSYGGEILYQGGVTLTGTPAFACCFAQATYGGFISYAGIAFTGSSTGPRVQITTGGQIQTPTGDVAALPGTSNGTVSFSPITTGTAATGVNITGSGGQTSLPVGTTAYMGIASVSTSQSDLLTLAAPYTLTNFIFKTNGNLPTAQSIVATLQLSGSATPLTCTIPAAAQSCTDTTHTVTVPAGSSFNVKLVTSAGIGTLTGYWGAIAY